MPPVTVPDGDRDEKHRKAHKFFEDLWQRDHWELETSAYEQARLDRLLQIVADRRYAHALEIGCGSGAFTKRLATLADRIVGVDISPTAIARAREVTAGAEGVELRVANAMELELGKEGMAWDLVVLSETIYYLGWLYPFFDLAWFAHELHDATARGGRLLLANTSGDVGDALILPWVVRTYHDLFQNVGYRREREELFRGEKNGVAFEVILSLMRRG